MIDHRAIPLLGAVDASDIHDDTRYHPVTDSFDGFDEVEGRIEGLEDVG